MRPAGDGGAGRYCFEVSAVARFRSINFSACMIFRDRISQFRKIPHGLRRIITQSNEDRCVKSRARAGKIAKGAVLSG
jgi:hypothetical protein